MGQQKRRNGMKLSGGNGMDSRKLLNSSTVTCSLHFSFPSGISELSVRKEGKVKTKRKMKLLRVPLEISKFSFNGLMRFSVWGSVLF